MNANEAVPAKQEAAPVGGRHRKYTGAAGKLVTAFCALSVLYCLLYVAGVLSRAGIHIYGGSHRSFILTFILVMTFLLFPAARGVLRSRLPWYDVMFILLSIVGGGYLMLNIRRIEGSFLPANTLEQVLALVTVFLVLEAGRRAVGWVFTVLGILFFTYPFYSYSLPGLFHTAPYSLRSILSLAYLDARSGINGEIMHIAAMVIIVFIAFGAFFELSGGGQFFIDLALGLIGRFRGGAAKVAVVASGLLGMVMSSGPANVATTGVFTIPLMKSIGYQPHFAAAVEASASIGGHFMPPVMASTAFLIADFLGISYLQVCIAAIIPAFLYYAALLVTVDLEAARTKLRGLDRDKTPSLRRTMANGWFFLLPIAVLLFFLVVLHYHPSTSGIYALGAVVLVSFLGKKEYRMTPRRCWSALDRGGRRTLEVGAAIAVGGLLTATLALTGIGIKITGQLVQLAGGNLFFILVLSAVIAIIMGMAVGPTAVYLTVAILCAPAMVAAGAVPIAAHLFVLFLSTASMITPPVCIPAYIAASIAGTDFVKTGLTACRLGIVAFLVPFIFCFSPQLLMIGSADQIALAALTALVGVFLLSAALEGYVLTSISLWPRVILAAAGVSMIIPGWITDVAGAAVGAAVLLWQAGTVRLSRRAAAEGKR